jgi:hypothetical protein
VGVNINILKGVFQKSFFLRETGKEKKPLMRQSKRKLRTM